MASSNHLTYIAAEDVVMIDLDVESAIASGNDEVIQHQSMDEDFLPDLPYGNSTMLLIF